MQAARAIENLEQKGGKLCLDFTNTVSWRISDHPIEWLHNYSDLLKWSLHIGMLKPAQVNHLLAEAKKRPEEAEAVYQQAVHFREALFRIFLAVVHQNTPLEGDLALLNHLHHVMLNQLQFVPAAKGYMLTWPAGISALDLPLWHLAKSAEEVLTSPALERLSLCAGAECGWLFFDQSKNHSRKWCDSQDCGNRDRVRRHYQKRTRAAGGI
ncbi:MAG TPA: ABATE domain-containing protein [Ktedonobacteraceae bacterium]|nr:ABATE domain-containing protein [Ktedonobacteraceae bacterium]